MITVTVIVFPYPWGAAEHNDKGVAGSTWGLQVVGYW